MEHSAPLGHGSKHRRGLPNLHHAALSMLSTRRSLIWLALALTLMCGTYFRTLSLWSWDGDHRLHPDERFMTMVAADVRWPIDSAEYLDSSRNPLNPRNREYNFFVYGLLPTTLTRLTAVILTPNDALPETVPITRSGILQIANPERQLPKPQLIQRLFNPGGRDLTQYPEIHKVGRAWSTIFDLLSIFVLFLMGCRLYDRRIALLGATLLGLAVLPIQQAHFFTIDSMTAFFTLFAMYWAIRIAQRGTLLSACIFGLSMGSAMACRFTLATLGFIGVFAALQYGWGGSNRRSLQARISALALQFAWLAIAGLLALIIFRSLQPDAFFSRSFWFFCSNDPVKPEQTAIIGVCFDTRFIQNVNEIKDIMNGEIDAPPSQQWANRTPYLFPLSNMIIWGMGVPLGMAAWLGWAFAGRQLWLRRHGIHALPWLAIFLYFLWQGGNFVSTMRYFLPLYGLLTLFAAWGLVTLWDYWGAASQDHRVSGPRAFFYRQSWLRWTWLFVLIATFCWAFAFTRIYTRPHSRNAATHWIYEHIPPGSKISYEDWDDALPLPTSNRHPNEYIQLKMFPYLEDDLIKYTGFKNPDGSGEPGLLGQLDELDYIILSSNRIYGSVTRLPMRYPVITRYYHYLFNGQLGFELVADITSYPSLFGIPIPDQSAEEAFSVYDHPRVLIFKKTASYSRAKAEQLIMGGIAWGEIYRLPTVLVSKAPTALRLTADQWPLYREAGTWSFLFNPDGLSNQLPWLFWLLVTELLGLGAFPILFRCLPSLPDRGFTLSKITGLLLVAYSAWLLGSFQIVAFTPLSVWLCALVLLSVGMRIALKNRRQLVIFVRQRRSALLAAEGLFLAAFFGFLLVQRANPNLSHAMDGERPMDLAFLHGVLKSAAFPPYDPWFAGGYINYPYFGFVLIGALTHLTSIVPTTAYQLAIPVLFALTALGSWGVSYNLIAAGGQPLRTRASTWWRLERRAIASGILTAILMVLAGNLAQTIWHFSGTTDQTRIEGGAECQQIGSDGSGALQLVCLSPNEDPFFTFLYGDLHTHTTALPLALAALALIVALVSAWRLSAFRAATSERVTFRRLQVLLGPILLLALVVGALRATNTWDYPTYLGLSIVAFALLAYRYWLQSRTHLKALLGLVFASIGFVLVGNLLFMPFIRSFATTDTHFEWYGPAALLLAVLQINGLWLFGLCSAGVLLLRRRYHHASATHGPSGAHHSRLATTGLLTIGWALVAFGLVLVSGLVVATGTRYMSMASKVGMQSWTLFAVCTGIALIWSWQYMQRWQISVRRTWRAAAALLVVAALVHPFTATPARIVDRFDPEIGLPLDQAAHRRLITEGTNSALFALPEDPVALTWMQRHISGTPIVLEAHNPSARSGRIATYSGLPTLLGWWETESQQRMVAQADAVLMSRHELITQIYTSTDPLWTRATLQLYGVEYVYLGQLERALYDPLGLAKFEQMAQEGLIEVVYSTNETQIYRIPRNEQYPPAILTVSLPLSLP